MYVNSKSGFCFFFFNLHISEFHRFDMQHIFYLNKLMIFFFQLKTHKNFEPMFELRHFYLDVVILCVGLRTGKLKSRVNIEKEINSFSG